jgi:plasmid stabilization system protein ParE
MKVRYTATALQEIEDILFYIAKENSSAALKVSLTIVATIDRVADFPRTAVEANVPGVSVAPVLPYRYLIFFSVDGDVLIVRNVRHSARRQPDLSEF